MFNFIKKYKIILIFLLFILFLLINTKVNAASTADLSTFTQEQKETISKTWKFAVDHTTNQGIDVTKVNYFVTYNNSNNTVGVFFLNPSKNTIREIGVSNGYYDCFNYFNQYQCKVGGNPTSVWSDGYNKSNIIRSYDTYTQVVIANNVTATYGYSGISRSIEDVDFINNPFNTSVLPNVNIQYNEKTSSYWVWTDWYDIREITLSCFLAFGKQTDFSPEDEVWYNDLVFSELGEEIEEGVFLERQGFELSFYTYYSFTLYDVANNYFEIKGLDFTEESLKGTEYEDCLNPLTNLNLYLDEYIKPPTVYSNWIDKEILDKCNLIDFSISFDNGETFSSVYINCEEEHTVEGKTYIRFYYKLFANDTYVLKLRIFDENYNAYEVEKTFTINSYEEIVDINGTDSVPATPFITAYADSDIIRFSTQTFKERVTLDIMGEVDTLRYKAFYIDDEAYQLFGDNYEDWILMDVGYKEYDKVIEGYPYYFKTEFSFDNLENGDKFYFIFYDNKLGCFSPVTTYILESKEDLYTISQNITFNNDKFQRIYDFFNDHFGFLTYPFEFIINLLNLILNINFEEPILHFPQIINPINDEVIFNGFDFNFNSILEYKGIAYFYNIYLIAVDFILVVAFVIGCKNTLEGVLGNG